MAEFGIFHNGSNSGKMKRTDEGKVLPDASLAEVHEEKKQVVKDQIESAVKAEEYGFDKVFFTEHHFQPTGSEFSPNPLITGAAVAAQTEEIRIGQLANIITWHDPVRLAEQTALLDCISDGRAEIGIGRGYQPRENEVLGQYWGGTIQDQEKNRVSFEEKYEILKKAWTEEAFSYHGEYHSIPPKHTKWHHTMERDYFEDDVTEQTLDEMMDWSHGGDFYSDLWSPIVSYNTKLKKISVFPQPVQEPHPPLWMPMTSQRSMEFAVKRGINGAFLGAPTEEFGWLCDMYYNYAEQHDWPDHRPEYDGEEFKYGWDSDRQRGVIAMRPVWLTDVVDEEATERYVKGLENAWNFFVPLITEIGSIFNADGPEDWIGPDEILSQEFLHIGTTDEIIDEIATFRDEIGYEDFAFVGAFETPGVGPELEQKQMKAFSERVMPYFEEE